MNLYLIHDDNYFGVDGRIKRFKEACHNLGVNCVVLDSRKTNFTSLPVLGKRDMLYKVSDGSYELESLLINDEATTFYINNPSLANIQSSTDLTLLQVKAGIPQPKTIFHNNTIERGLLSDYIRYLGGFPIIIKMYGKSRGVGIIKIDSWEAYVSIIDYLVEGRKKFVIRKFIKTDRAIRFIVLGDKVISSWYTPLMDNDFRNVTDASLLDLAKAKVPQKYPEEIEQIAVEATRCSNLHFSAVDMVTDEGGNPFVLEVNFPCGLNFEPSGNNLIVEQMVAFLIEKSQNRR